MSRSLDRLLPPLDLHAHLDPTVTRAQLATLQPALVFAVTRSLDEAEVVRSRSDDAVVWGCGVHPGLRDGIERFDVSRLRAVLSGFTFLGEIGLDRKADTPAARQILEQLGEILTERPLIASVHSTGRAGPVVEILTPALHRTILHWFTGTREQIERAVAGGAYFSINTAMTDEQLTRLPPDRVLPETDYPFTRRAGSARPGDIAQLEDRLTELWSKTHEDIRRGWYRNLRALCLQAEVLDLLPEAIVALVVSA